MEEAAAAVAEAVALRLSTVRVAVPAGASPEGQARAVRYRALESELSPREWLLTGHTADDQAETVLANLLRGAGTDGLAGIPVRRGRVVRPLLEVWRAEIRELATLLRLPWRDDPANADPEPLRNVVRRRLIPDLESRFNRALRASLVRTAGVLAAEAAVLESLAEPVAVHGEEGMAQVAAAALQALPPPVAARVVRRALRSVVGGHAGGERDVRQALGVARAGGRAELSGGVVAERVGPWLRLGAAAAPAPPAAAEWLLPGRVRYQDWTLEAWIETTPPVAFPLSAWQAVFDADAVGDRALVRSVGPGDRLPVPGGHKQARDVLAESGVPAAARRAWPVVEVGGEVVWLPGVRRARSGWVRPATRRYLWAVATREGS